MLRICIITEGGRENGFGHIIRCCSIYQAFYERKQIPLFLINSDIEINSIIPKKIKYELSNWLENSSDFFTLINNFDIVVIDSYLADYHFYEYISKHVKLPVYIDDNNRIEYPSGIVVNAMVYANNLYNNTDRKSKIHSWT